MSRIFLVIISTVIVATVRGSTTPGFRSAADVAIGMYRDCLQDYSVSCVQPRATAWFNHVIGLNEIKITDGLSIIRTSSDDPQPRESTNDNTIVFRKIDNFLAAHALKVKPPLFFQTVEARSIIPEFLLDNSLTKGAVVPLSDGKSVEGEIMLNEIIAIKFNPENNLQVVVL